MPVFVAPASGGATASVAENVDTTHTVYTVQVTDRDGESISFSFNQSPGSKFTLDGNDVKLAAGQTIDFENYPGPYTLSFV